MPGIIGTNGPKGRAGLAGEDVSFFNLVLYTLNVLNFARIKFRDFREFAQSSFFASIKFRESACINYFACTNFREFLFFDISKTWFGA